MHTISSLPPIGYIIAEYNPFFYPNLSKLSGCVFAIRILFGRFAPIIGPLMEYQFKQCIAKAQNINSEMQTY